MRRVRLEQKTRARGEPALRRESGLRVVAGLAQKRLDPLVFRHRAHVRHFAGLEDRDHTALVAGHVAELERLLARRQRPSGALQSLARQFRRLPGDFPHFVELAVAMESDVAAGAEGCLGPLTWLVRSVTVHP